MNRRRYGLHLLVVGLVIVAGMNSFGRAADANAAGEAVKPFLEPSTVAVVGVKRRAMDGQLLRPLMHQILPARERLVSHIAAPVEALEQILGEAGAKEIYLVFSLADQFQEMPFMVVPHSGDLDTNAVATVLQRWQDRPFQHRKLHGATVFASGSTLDRLAGLQASSLPANAVNPLDIAIAAVGESAVWAAITASGDHRRAVEAMQPNLPPALGGGDVQVLTRGIEWIAVAADTPPEAAVRVTVQASDPAAANDLQRVAEQGVRSLQSYAPIAEAWPELAQGAGELIPSVEGDQLRLTFGPANHKLKQLLDLASQPLQRMLVQQARWQDMTDLKQLALAMHNYHDTYKHLPAAGITDAEGRPLLSWRVHLLPFLEQRKLYEQFHLDEPWDSEHNRALISKMPEVFHAGMSQHLPSDGRANFVVPGGESAMFPPGEGIEFKQVTDGLSNTIMIAEVDDEHAEIWTKPGAYEIDLESPASGLGGHFPGVFLTALGDGSANAIPLDLPKESLRGLFTRSGREVVRW